MGEAMLLVAQHFSHTCSYSACQQF